MIVRLGLAIVSLVRSESSEDSSVEQQEYLPNTTYELSTSQCFLPFWVAVNARLLIRTEL